MTYDDRLARVKEEMTMRHLSIAGLCREMMDGPTPAQYSYMRQLFSGASRSDTRLTLIEAHLDLDTVTA